MVHLMISAVSHVLLVQFHHFGCLGYCVYPTFPKPYRQFPTGQRMVSNVILLYKCYHLYSKLGQVNQYRHCLFIHPLATLLILQRVAKGWDWSQLTLGERRCRHLLDWLPGCQSQDRHTETGNHSHSHLHLHVLTWTVWGHWSTRRNPTWARGEHANCTQKVLSGPAGSNPVIITTINNN